MYLQHVLPAIAEGRFTFRKQDVLTELPDGLKGYYERHWREMQTGRETEFKSFIKPIICILGVAREHASINQISNWTKIDQDDVRKYIVLWREFLNEIPVKKYLIYHASFQDFLRNEVGLTEDNNKIVEHMRSLIGAKA
jgi:hypothetical protein